MPTHQHPQEQIVHVLEGRMRLIVSGVVHEMKIGDSFYLASNILHAVETIENTLVLDTFSPPRGDYLLLDKTAHGKSWQAVTITVLARPLASAKRRGNDIHA
jgi:quercetin dioxygenase-like cupin family protein